MIKRAIKKLIMLFKQEKLVSVIKQVPNTKLLEGKIALITGGSSGIGFAIAEALIESGAKVIICRRNQKKLEASVERLNLHDNRAKGLVCDVSDIISLPDKVKEASELFGESRIDILVNSAGVISKHDFWKTDENDFDSLMDINAKGTFFMSQAVAKFMIDKKIEGHILNVSSSSALRPAWTPYQMSKWAIKGFTLGLADLLLPYGIVVNAIAPGQTATPIFGKDSDGNIYNANVVGKRYILPEEIASLAVFMVSGMGDMIVGDTFYMTGGSGLISLHK